MAKINAKRLLKLADYLETVPRERFAMASWTSGRGCGFSGCAIGWAAHGKLFRGFELAPDEDELGGFAPTYKGYTNWPAIAELFSLSKCYEGDSAEAEHLFLLQKYSKPPTPKQVATRIRKFVRDNEKASAE